MIRDNRKPKPKPKGPGKADPNARRKPEKSTDDDKGEPPKPMPKKVRLSGRKPPKKFTPEGYWDKRKDHAYYRAVQVQVEERWPEARSILDVGGGHSRILDRFSFERKAVADMATNANLYGEESGVEYFVTDGTTQQFKDGEFDVVICLQTIEHNMPDPADLLRVARLGVVVTYPYKWRKGTSIHLGKDEAWLKGKMGVDPSNHSTAADNGVQRGIAVYVLENQETE